MRADRQGFVSVDRATLGPQGRHPDGHAFLVTIVLLAGLAAAVAFPYLGHDAAGTAVVGLCALLAWLVATNSHPFAFGLLAPVGVLAPVLSTSAERSGLLGIPGDPYHVDEVLIGLASGLICAALGALVLAGVNRYLAHRAR